ncbi:MAG: hypothetical protein COT81_05425 [Candidatus Buchananbacteria bacterium CG10_big_fil_rev_8_21_14_0_10_42_9]|uniref:O-antigen ligase-related domain-containing protein n=1 Tax=Candidatus Buchananbacteria bacterium CG10_big_fil_rev_8_21_14_0_10_42_9 TaxID=1974526 RepID=A0A2H0VZU2_9BACT|nr:MAG: hypothetical protein COT81_05425 [Candidatus Buchananbacteria bacterium CG10_big_fil_rev_8_21_14_0_10_42_9]
MFNFDFHWQIQNILLPYWTAINIGLLLILAVLIYLGFKRPNWANALVVALLPTYLFRGHIGNIPFTYLELALLIIILIWLIRNFIWKELFKPNPYRYGLIAILTAGVVGTFIAPETLKALGLFKAYLIEPILFFLVLSTTSKTNEDKKLLLGGLGVSTILISTLAIWQKFSGFGIAEPIWQNPETRRVTSIFTSPNAVGLYLAPIVILYLGWLWQNYKNIQATILKLFIIVPGVIAIIFTVSQGTWLGLAAAIVFLAYFGWNKKITIAGVTVIIIVALLMPASRHQLLPLLTFSDPAGQNRIMLWQGTIDFLADSPKNFLLGGGIYSFYHVLDSFRDPLKLEPLIYPHNIILNFWIDLGILGLVAFTYIFVKFFQLSFKSELLAKQKYIGLAVIAAMVTILIHGLIDVPYFKNDLAVLFWVIVSLTINSREKIPSVP